jgi:hypothetical protein
MVFSSIPIEIINNILSYDQALVILQFHPKTYVELYKINLKSPSIWHIEFAISMKQLYPIFYGFPGDKNAQKILYWSNHNFLE